MKDSTADHKFKDLLLNSVSDSIIATNLNGEITFWNKAAEQLYKWKEKDVLGKNIVDVTPSKASAIQANEIMKSLIKGESWEGEFDVQDKNGRVFPVYVRNYPINDSEGNLIGIIGVSKDISEEKKIVETLENEKLKVEESERLLNEMGSMAKVGAWQLDLETNELTWTEEVYKIHEVDDDFVPTVDKAIDFYDENSKEVISDLLNEAINKGGNFDTSLSIITAKGNTRHVRAIGKTILNNDGKPETVFGTFQDISQNYAYEEKLKLSDRVFNLTLDMFCIAGFNGYFKYLNPAWEKTLGWSIDELLSKPWLDFVHPEDKEKTENVKYDIIDGNKIYQFENRYICKDGSVKWLSWNSQPFPDENIMIGAVRDITRAKQSEKELAKNKQEFQTWIENTPVCTKKLDLNSNLQFMSEAGIRELKVDDVHKLYGKPYPFSFFPEEIKKTMTATIQEVKDNGDIRHIDGILADTQGNRMWYNHILVPVKNTDGELDHILIISSDISKRKKVEQELLKAKEDAENNNKINEARLELIKYSENHTKDEIIEETLNIAEQVCESKIGFFHFLDDDQQSIHLQNWSTQTKKIFCKTESHSIHYPIDKAGVWVDCVHEKKPVIHNNYEALSHKKGLPEGHAKLVRELVIPVIYGDKVKAVFGVGNKEQDYTQKDVENIKLLAYLSWEILEKKKITENLVREKNRAEENELKYRLLIDNINDLVCEIDAKGVYTFVSNNYKEILGYKPDDLLGKPVIDLIHPDDLQASLKKFEKINVESGTSKDVWRFLHKDGTYRYIESKGNVYQYSKNEKRTVVISSDITEKKKQEILFKSSLESPMDMIILSLDHNYRYLYFNETHKKEMEFAYGKAPQIGDCIFDYISNNDDILKIKERYDEGLKGESNVSVDAYGDKKRRYYEMRINPIRDENKKIIGITSFAFDITQRKEIENELKLAKEKAEESDRLKTAFLANMSHEIRTPMNGILGFANLLREPGLNGEEQQKYIDIINKSGNRMLNTIQDIIDISKIESGQVSILMSDFELNKQVNELFDFFLPEARQKNINLSIKKQLPEHQVYIHTDKDKLDSILTNLIKNAIKYTLKGNIEIGYGIEESEGKEKLKFYIQDTGLGIPKDRQEAIFNRFVQADIEDQNVYEGSGLGLAISKAYVEMLEGEMWVESEPGSGSTFYFTLPNISPDKTIRKDQRILNNKEPKKKQLKVLIVEDEQYSIEFLEIILKDYVREFIVANNGTEAVEICKTCPDIDLILMDIKLPGMNGYEATQKIREFNKNVPIIAQTAYAFEGDVNSMLEAGCNDVISKPIRKEELIEVINNFYK